MTAFSQRPRQAHAYRLVGEVLDPAGQVGVLADDARDVAGEVEVEPGAAEGPRRVRGGRVVDLAEVVLVRPPLVVRGRFGCKKEERKCV